ncbi:MAG: hypothetical protein NTX64_03225 [Elusimicrobia bacterium]|nr:hypothetical protein [Elusimicrobiota bacterium]
MTIQTPRLLVLSLFALCLGWPRLAAGDEEYKPGTFEKEVEKMAAEEMGVLNREEDKKLQDVLNELKREAVDLRTKGLAKDADKLDSYIEDLNGVEYHKFKEPHYAGGTSGNIYLGDSFFAIRTGSEGDAEEDHRKLLAQGALLLHEIIHARHQRWLEKDEKAPYGVETEYLDLFEISADSEPTIWQNVRENTDKAFLVQGGYSMSPHHIDLAVGSKQTFTLTGPEALSAEWGVVEADFRDSIKRREISATGESQAVFTVPQKIGAYHVYAEYRNGVVGYAVIIARDAQVFVTPQRFSMVPGETADFKAELKFAPEDAPKDITWSLPLGYGKITQDGRFTAPDAPGTYRIRATAFERSADAIVTVKNIKVSITPKGPWTVKPLATKEFKVSLENARDKSLRWSLQGCGRLSYEDSSRLDNIFCAPKEPCTAKVVVESAQDPRAKDSVDIEVVSDSKPKPKPEEPAKTPGISTVNITEFNLPGLSFTPGFVTISPATQGVVMVMVTAAANPILGMTMPSDVTKSPSAVLVSGGLSTPKVYGSVSGSLIIKEWSTSSGNRISGSFTAAMLDDDTKATGSVKANFSVYVASGNGL